jgi:hypothetical protein
MPAITKGQQYHTFYKVYINCWVTYLQQILSFKFNFIFLSCKAQLNCWLTILLQNLSLKANRMLAHVALQILLPRANVKHCLRCLLQQLVTNAPIEQPITWDQCFLCHFAAPGFELLISG